MPDRTIKKILLLRFSSLGDIVMATAMIRNVRQAFPHAQIDMVVRADFLDLIRFNPHLDGKIGLSRTDGSKALRALVNQCNAEHYDLVYDAHRSLRTRFLMPQIRAPRKCYFEKNYVKRSLALTFKLPLLRGAPRMLEKYVEPLAPWGVVYDGRGPELFIDEATEARGLSKVTLPPGELVGIIPSAQWPGKRWPLAHFRTVLERWVKETPHGAVVFGGPEDTFCTELCEGLPGNRVYNAQGKLSIAESAAVLKRCRFVLANDTGLMHMADALNVPSLLILGPTSAELGCLPFHPQAHVFEHNLWCRPCSKNGQAPCIRSRRYCLEDTHPETVFAAARRMVPSA